MSDVEAIADKRDRVEKGQTRGRKHPNLIGRNAFDVIRDFR